MSLDTPEDFVDIRRSNFGGKGGAVVQPVAQPLDVASPSPTPDWGGKGGAKPAPPLTPTPALTAPPQPAPPSVAPPVASPTQPLGQQGLGLDFMRQVTPNELVENRLNGLLSSNSPYIRNARQRGVEYAASRGNVNSSIAAGASQRAALEAAMPIAESDAGAYRDANRGNFESLSQLRQMRTAADLDNWLSSESYTRDFNGRLAMLPIQSSADMLTYITQRALEDPAVYTPDVISGFNNFFNLNMQDMFSNFYGPRNLGGGG